MLRVKPLIVTTILALVGYAWATPVLKEFQTRNIFGSKIGIGRGNKEIAITLDDGPGRRTLELARFLAREGVPATFFMQGNNASARISDVEKIANLKLSDGSYAHNISNHTWSHININRAEAGTVVNQILNTDKKLSSFSEISNQIIFFRAPYGAWANGVHAGRLNNTADLAKIVGPVFWDIGGVLNDKYAADWACWSQGVSVSECKRRYVRETVDKQGGIILLHDIHSKTIDMLIGENGLIRELKSKGFKFVRLDEHRDTPSFKALLGSGAKYYDDQGDPLPLPGRISFSYTTLDNGDTQLKVSCPDSDRIEIYVDRLNRMLVPAINDSRAKFTYTFNTPGKRYMTPKCFLNGELNATMKFEFNVGGASVDEPEGEETLCVVSVPWGKTAIFSTPMYSNKTGYTVSNGVIISVVKDYGEFVEIKKGSFLTDAYPFSHAYLRKASIDCN